MLQGGPAVRVATALLVKAGDERPVELSLAPVLRDGAADGVMVLILAEGLPPPGLGLLLGFDLQAGQAGLEVLAGHFVHVEDQVHHLEQVGRGPSMAQVTRVASPSATRVKIALLWASSA